MGTAVGAAAQPRHTAFCSCLRLALACTLLLLGCQLCSCQLDLQGATEAPQVLFGELTQLALDL
jgi:hypothetical protein